jgi:hypothetical protein
MTSREKAKFDHLRTPEQLAIRGIPLGLSEREITDEYARREEIIIGVGNLFDGQIIRNARINGGGLPERLGATQPKRMAEAYVQLGRVSEAVNLGIFSVVPTERNFWRHSEITVINVLDQRSKEEPFNSNLDTFMQAIVDLGTMSTKSYIQTFRDQNSDI